MRLAREVGAAHGIGIADLGVEAGTLDQPALELVHRVITALRIVRHGPEQPLDPHQRINAQGGRPALELGGGRIRIGVAGEHRALEQAQAALGLARGHRRAPGLVWPLGLATSMRASSFASAAPARSRC